MRKLVSIVACACALLIALAIALSAAIAHSADAPSDTASAEIPPYLLRAYIDAARTCPGLPWEVLAAIGWTESRHAAGRADPITGDVRPPIVGPPIDGTNGTVNQYGYLYFQGSNSQTLAGNGTILLGTNSANSVLENLQGASAKVTIGPGILFLSFADRPLGKLAQPFIIFGRVPMFYYLLHAPLIHALAVAIAWANGQGPLGSFLGAGQAPGYGYSLGVVYALWILVVFILYFPCRWFADLKRRRSDIWLSYF